MCLGYVYISLVRAIFPIHIIMGECIGILINANVNIVKSKLSQDHLGMTEQPFRGKRKKNRTKIVNNSKRAKDKTMAGNIIVISHSLLTEFIHLTQTGLRLNILYANSIKKLSSLETNIGILIELFISFYFKYTKFIY